MEENAPGKQNRRNMENINCPLKWMVPPLYSLQPPVFEHIYGICTKEWLAFKKKIFLYNPQTNEKHTSSLGRSEALPGIALYAFHLGIVFFHPLPAMQWH